MSLRVYLFEPRTRGAGGGLWPGCVVSAHPTTHNFAIESTVRAPNGCAQIYFLFFSIFLFHTPPFPCDCPFLSLSLFQFFVHKS